LRFDKLIDKFDQVQLGNWNIQTCFNLCIMFKICDINHITMKLDINFRYHALLWIVMHSIWESQKLHWPQYLFQNYGKNCGFPYLIGSICIWNWSLIWCFTCCFLNFEFHEPTIVKNSTLHIWKQIISSDFILKTCQVMSFGCWKFIQWIKNRTLKVLNLHVYKWAHFSFIILFSLKF
jgi:hypothetical protein